MRIVAEGEDKAVEQLIELVQITKPPIRVERVEVQAEPPTGEFEYFEIKRGKMAEELGERLDVFNALLTEMLRRHDS